MSALKPQVEGWSLVIAGHWNKMIFSPDWIIGRLTSTKEIGIEFPVDNPALPIRFVFDGIHLKVGSRRVEINIDRCEDALLANAKKVALKILQELPHTPITAIGFNFQFVADSPDGKLLEISNYADLNDLSDTGIKILSSSITRKLDFDGQVINLSFGFQENSKLVISFNFHQDTSDSTQAMKFLESHSVDLKQKALTLLKNVYGCTPEMEVSVL